MNKITVVIRLIWSDYKIWLIIPIIFIAVISIPFVGYNGGVFSCDGYSISVVKGTTNLITLWFDAESITVHDCIWSV